MVRSEIDSAVKEGMSISQLAERFGCSRATVRYWLRKHELSTLRAGRRSAGVPRVCAVHGEGMFVREGSGYLRCGRCRSEAVARRRRKVKEILVAEAGGEVPAVRVLAHRAGA